MFQTTVRQRTWQIGQENVPIWMTTPLQNLSINLEVVALEKSPLGIHKILRLFVNTLIVDGKHYLLNRDNLAQRIHMQLSQKQKNFCELFLILF